MFIDERSHAAGASAAVRHSARLPWMASTPSSASELVCVGKIKSNGVSQSLFIDRSKWPPKMSQQNASQQARPHQTRAAAVVAAATVAAAAPKVICISPVPNARRSHTVIRRATTAAQHHYHGDHTDGSATPLTEAVSTAESTKRTFDKTQDGGDSLPHARAVDARRKAARIVDADSAPTHTVLPGSSVLLPGWASKSSGDTRQLRPILPRNMFTPGACATTHVINIVPSTTASACSVIIPPPTSTPVPPLSPSPLAACTQTSSAARSSPVTTATFTASRVECRDRSVPATQLADVASRSTNYDKNEAVVSGSQLLQRVRLIECEMATANNAPAVSQAPFCINVVPLPASADVRPPSSQLAATAVTAVDRPADSDRGDDDDNHDAGDDQPPAKMLEALRLVRNHASRPPRDVILTSSAQADAELASDASARRRAEVPPSESAAASRLVTLKLVNRSTQ